MGARQAESLRPIATRVPSVYIAAFLVAVVAALGAMAMVFIFGGPEASAIAIIAVASVVVAVAVSGVVRFWLYLRYLRYVVDQAAQQGVRIDLVAVIEASAVPGLGALRRRPWRHRDDGTPPLTPAGVGGPKS